MEDVSDTAIKACFPDRVDAQDLFPNDEEQSPMRIDTDMLLIAIDGLPRHNAGGMSGWTYDLIQCLARLGNYGAIFVEKLTEVYNHLLAGKGGDPAMWLRPKFIPLAKQSSTSIRPICISEPFVLLLSRTIAASVSVKKRHYFAPLQWAVGIPNGVSKIVHTAQLEATLIRAVDYDDRMDRVIQTIDLRNAFNSFHRGALYKNALVECAYLVPYLRWIYGDFIDLYLTDGSCPARCGRGVLQGDPLGTLYFSLALQPILVALQNKYPALKINAYADDITIIGSKPIVDAAKLTLEQLVGQIGLQVNHDKCHQYGPYHAPLDEGVMILGSLVGASDANTEKFTRSVLSDASKYLPQLVSKLEARIALPLLKYCINARPTYLARTNVKVYGAKDFDDSIDRALTDLIGFAQGAEVPTHLGNLRMAAYSDGGLAMPRLEVINGPAFAASFTHAMHAIACYEKPYCGQLVFAAAQGTFAPLMEHAARFAPKHYTTRERGDLEHSVEPEAPAETIPKVWNDPALAGSPEKGQAPSTSQKVLTAEYKATIDTSIDIQLGPLHDQMRAQYLSNSFIGSAHWIEPTNKVPIKLTAQAYLDTLRLRLLTKTTNQSLSAKGDPLTLNNKLQCPCCAKVLNELPSEFDATYDPIFHCLSCRGMTNIRTTRHNKVRQAVVGVLSLLFNKESIRLPKEPVIDNHQHRGDILVVFGGTSYVLDITIVNAASVTNVQRVDSHTTPGAAAKAAEERKLAKYAANGATSSAYTTIPFVLEATGRLGTMAEDFIQLTCNASTYPNKFGAWENGLNRARSEIHSSNSIAIDYYKRHFRALPLPRPPNAPQLAEDIFI